eukprot:5589154-Lingulodinium_polyedra.AAC.1
MPAAPPDQPLKPHMSKGPRQQANARPTNATSSTAYPLRAVLQPGGKMFALTRAPSGSAQRCSKPSAISNATSLAGIAWRQRHHANAGNLRIICPWVWADARPTFGAFQ